MKEGECKDCEWWDELDEGAGMCRKHPPTFTLFMSGGSERSSSLSRDDGVWPITENDDWCGEFYTRMA